MYQLKLLIRHLVSQNIEKWEEQLNWALKLEGEEEGEAVWPIWGCAVKAWSQPWTSTLLNHISRATVMASSKEMKGEDFTTSSANLVLLQQASNSSSSTNMFFEPIFHSLPIQFLNLVTGTGEVWNEIIQNWKLKLYLQNSNRSACIVW